MMRTLCKYYRTDPVTVAAGQQLVYSFDTIGNRTQTQAGGDQNGANLRVANYTNNTLNQITGRDVPGDVDVLGLSYSSDTVTVNGQNAYRKGEYFRQQLSVNNSSSPLWTNITVSASGVGSVSGNVYVAQEPEQFSYDADGNLASDGRWNYTWDAENRLVALTNVSSVPTGAKMAITFAYDWKGRRIQKIVFGWSGSAYTPQSTNRFAYDGWNLVAELNPQNSPIRTYVWGLDLSGGTQDAGGVGGLLEVSYSGAATTNCFVTIDGNGNVAGLVNEGDGSLAADYEYGPFGELLRATGPMAKANPLRFSTKYQDDETDLLYYGYRYYNAGAGVWRSRDRIAERGGLNLYSLVDNDPISQVDSLGLLVSIGWYSCPSCAWKCTFKGPAKGPYKNSMTTPEWECAYPYTCAEFGVACLGLHKGPYTLLVLLTGSLANPPYKNKVKPPSVCPPAPSLFGIY